MIVLRSHPLSSSKQTIDRIVCVCGERAAYSILLFRVPLLNSNRLIFRRAECTSNALRAPQTSPALRAPLTNRVWRSPGPRATVRLVLLINCYDHRIVLVLVLHLVLVFVLVIEIVNRSNVCQQTEKVLGAFASLLIPGAHLQPTLGGVPTAPRHTSQYLTISCSPVCR